MDAVTNLNKKEKTIYWIATGLLALFIVPGIIFLNSDFAKEGTRHLGMPMWFHWELGIAKFIGGILLVLPFVGPRIKEWIYVAFSIDFISAIIGLLSVDGLQLKSFSPLITFVLLVISYRYYHKGLNRSRSTEVLNGTR